ncbi:MAG: ATP-binding protein [Atopobium sp.]|uniref:ATP-binding protein n=1 Tax=Atopobium sp. TaxID=1872650 RepID=UPI002A74C22D|nr:ATP-binding protein [Atopobium sp.]MDY2787901.1 ATP-binding protein [Atopobium sp.]
MVPNPFKPTAGKRPPVLIGRDAMIEDFEEGLDNGAGAPGRLMLLTGNRGCGKTVLLRELQHIALERGWKVISDTASPGLCNRLAEALRSSKPRVTAMEIGPSFGRLSVEAARAKGETLRELVNNRLASMASGKGLLITIDEAQASSIEELATLAVLYQQILGDQEATGLPDDKQRGLALVFAALPSMVDDLLEENSITFLRRAQQRTLGMVPQPEVRDAYRQTIKASGLEIAYEVAEYAAQKSMGHPYMVQLVGYYMWRAAARRKASAITLSDVELGYKDAVSEFFEAVDAPLYYSLRSPQRLFIEAMAHDGQKPSQMADIIKRCKHTQSWASKYRASLIRERVIEPAGYGLVRFAVPLLGEYIREKIFWHD